MLRKGDKITFPEPMVYQTNLHTGTKPIQQQGTLNILLKSQLQGMGQDMRCYAVSIFPPPITQAALDNGFSMFSVNV